MADTVSASRRVEKIIQQRMAGCGETNLPLTHRIPGPHHKKMMTRHAPSGYIVTQGSDPDRAIGPAQITRVGRVFTRVVLRVDCTAELQERLRRRH